LNAVGQALYDDTRCLVGLSQKVQGHTVYCRYPKNSCPRRKHTELQSTLGKRGPVGVYQQLPNFKGVVYDAIANTYMTQSEYEGRRKANHDLLTRLGSSPQKEATESLLRPRRKPAIRIDTSPPGPWATRVGDWSRNLPETPHAAGRLVKAAPQGGEDGAVVSSLLATLMDRVNSLSAAQTSLAQENKDVNARLVEQKALAEHQQAEIQRLCQAQTDSGLARGRRDDRSRPDVVSVPSGNRRNDHE
jgi:hypothetical protein